MPLTSIKSKNLLWILLPALIWVGLYALRPVTFHPWCAVQPTPCTVDRVNAFDRIVFQFHSKFFDFLSNVVQNAMGVIFAVLPIVFIREPKRLIRLETFVLAGAFWNGACLEFTRIIAQRPRPLVMSDPMGDGSLILQYTSFYSGHTSFVAYAALISVLWMNQETGPNQKYGKLVWILYPLIVVATATLRVLGGRHYPTDTICGAIAGSLVAVVTFKFYEKAIAKSLSL